MAEPWDFHASRVMSQNKLLFVNPEAGSECPVAQQNLDSESVADRQVKGASSHTGLGLPHKPSQALCHRGALPKLWQSEGRVGKVAHDSFQGVPRVRGVG